jgi:hypothetical protein
VFARLWLGVSAERQQEADDRIPLLLQTPAAIRFVSAEPLLGPIDFTVIEAPDKVKGERWTFSALDTGDYYTSHDPTGETALTSGGDGPYRDHKLDWIIVGGESGPKARPMHAQWARDIRDQCKAAGVAFFFKQWGEWAPLEANDTDPHGNYECRLVNPDGKHISSDACASSDFSDRARYVYRLGKKKAGRLLDGGEHNEFPKRRQSVADMRQSA